MVYRLKLTSDECIDISVVKYIAGSTIAYTIPPGVYEISDFSLMLKLLLPGKVKVNITNDDNRLKSNLIINKTIRFTEKNFLLFHLFLSSHTQE